MKIVRMTKSVIKILIVSLFIIGLEIMPAFAKIDGMVSKHHFYDTQNTIMPAVVTDSDLKTGKYWDKNLFYMNKYRPLFMLSNKDLFNLMPENERRMSVVQRIKTPSIYNISLKTSSIKVVALHPINKNNEVKKNAAAPIVKDFRSFSFYESAKTKDVTTDKKIESAIALKATKNISNYSLAIDLLDDVTRVEPYNAYAFYLKGELYALKKDSNLAMKNYTQALKINPYSKQSCLGIAKILEQTNKELAQKYYALAK